MQQLLSQIKDKLDLARKYADRIRSVIDTVASIPIIGTLVPGLAMVRATADTLDTVIDDVDDLVDKLAAEQQPAPLPKAA